MGYVTEKFSRRLKELREESGLTQEQLANELGVSRGAISYYEKGTRTPDIEFINSLYEFFNFEYSIEYLLGYSNNKQKEYVDMSEVYGLSDHACRNLARRTGELGKIISQVIEHEEFVCLKTLLDLYTDSSSHFERSQIGYVSYLVTDSLLHIVHDVLGTTFLSHSDDNDSKTRFNEIERALKHDKNYSDLSQITTPIEVWKNLR